MTALSRGWKKCTGCELTIALYMFHRNKRGNPQGRCKACHRDQARESYRRRYRESWTFAESERYKSRKRYDQDAGYRERRAASDRALRKRMRAA